MKATELFLLINEIDDKLIDDAENEVQPEKIVIKNGLPFKEIMAFAACFAVLAVGIFTIIRFKTSGIPPADSTVSPAVSSENSSYEESNSSDNSDISTVSDPEKDPKMVKDTAFSHVIQPYLEKGSFPDILRGIMLRAVTVEELEEKIHAADTENKVTEIKVTKNPDSPDGEYKTGSIPVTSGNITDVMTIDITYDDGTDKRVGVEYRVGKFFDEYYGQIMSEGDFACMLIDATEQAKTVEQLRELVSEVDIHDRVNEIHVYTSSKKVDEVTSGILENGMVVYIHYDNESWMEGAICGR